MNPLAALSLFFFLACSMVAAEVYDEGYEPHPPVALPAKYGDYQILPRSISPGHRYAFLYPKRSRLYELPRTRLYLACLKPFSVVSEIPIQDRSLAANAHGYYTVHWTADASAAVFIVGAKWGPDQVWLAQLRDQKGAKLTNLVRVVRQRVLPDYDKAHAPPYNDYYNFIFEGGDQWTVTDAGGFTFQRGWDFDDAGHVIIDSVCTTDPKEVEPDRWAVRFKGIWNIAKSKFIKVSITPLPKRPSQALQ